MQNLKFGGAEKILITFLNRFDREKYTVNLILHTKEGELINEVPPDVSIKGIVPVDNGKLINKIKRSIFFKLSKYFPIILKICLNVYLGSADINIAYMEGITTKIVSFLKGPKVAWVHTDLENNSWTDVFFKNLDDQKNTYEKFKKIVFVSEGGKTAFNNKFKNTAQDRQVVIHNPIDNVQIEKKAKIVDNDFNKWAKKTENTVRLISVGRTDPVKRYGLLIKAVTKMIDRNESVTLTIIGDGQDTHKLIDLATGYNCFYFVGFKENPLPYVKKSDIFISTSSVESYPTAIAESLVLGTPVLATENAGSNEIINSRKCLLKHDISFVELSNSISNALENKTELTEIAFETGKNFDINKTLIEYDLVFKEASQSNE
ncbi:polysaccharide biosynthesis protein [Paucilactobacillus hokkaidonensis JCM 18461]|uniref:Polysaccharide biosynthesis protein n=2 Tax=Paucilactobacillus hokkaidonensis TaxID=1193095 RepID=A0A0A1GS42_9LACO|nr:glycosyltransferase [Paucilactobacillus hokkaidonensis]BAP84820.1 polysaccharide biosynthesis protein [Paucilactobacillus hokkaidonensis JCM 18461]